VKTSVRWRHNGLELRLPWRSTRVTDPAFFAGRSAGALPTARSCRARQGAGPDGGRDGLRKSTGTVCGLPALCRTPSRPSTHLHRTCGASQVQVCGLGRCVLSGGTRGQVCGAGVQGPSEVLASAGGYSSARNSSSILSATYIFSRDW